jgi:putative oligomerization/nucleic acid binding protein
VVLFGGNRRLEANLRHSGLTATADVSDAEQTRQQPRSVGVHAVDDQSTTTTWRLRLQVNPDGEAPFDAKLTEAVPRGEEIAVGQRMAVLYDPNDHSRIAIDHGSQAAIDGVEAELSAAAVHETPPDPTALKGCRTSSPDEDTGIFRRGMLAHPSARGPKLTDVSRATRDGVSAELLEDKVAKLADLRDRGALTVAEFEEQKRQILGG